MYDNEFGSQIKEYRYSISRYSYLIIALLSIVGLSWFFIDELIHSDFEWYLLGVLLFIGYAVYVTVREWRFIKHRLTVYEHGLYLQTHEWNVGVAITEIADMYFIKKYLRGARTSRSVFSLHVTLEDGRHFEMRLLSFDSLLTRFTYDFLGGKTIPKMPEVVAFYENWYKKYGYKRMRNKDEEY